MSAPSLENEVIRLRRENGKLLRRLFDVLDREEEQTRQLVDLNNRLVTLESLIDTARSNSEKRRGHRQTEPTNQVADQKE